MGGYSFYIQYWSGKQNLNNEWCFMSPIEKDEFWNKEHVEDKKKLKECLEVFTITLKKDIYNICNSKEEYYGLFKDREEFFNRLKDFIGMFQYDNVEIELLPYEEDKVIEGFSIFEFIIKVKYQNDSVHFDYLALFSISNPSFILS